MFKEIVDAAALRLLYNNDEYFGVDILKTAG